MDGLEDLLHEVATHIALHGLCGTALENLVVAGVLEYGDTVLLLELTNLAGYTHALGELLYDAVVALVDELAQLSQVFGAVCLGTDDEHLEDVFERVGSNLLHMDFWDEQNLNTTHAIKDAITEFLADTFGFVMNLFVICTIRKLLKPMTQGQPYDGTVSRTLKKLGIGCILICVVVNLFNALQIQSTHAVFFEIVERNLIGVVSGIASGFSLQLGYLFIGIVLLVFSLVFRYGEELQVQADETLYISSHEPQ